MVKNKKEKIYEYNPHTNVIRWRYTNEHHDKFGGQTMGGY